MSHDESNIPPSEVRDSPLGIPILPAAWQPLTPRGIAAFARARLGPLLIVQFLVASLVTAAVIWFLNVAWLPTGLRAMDQLSETGLISHGRLFLPQVSPSPLARNHFIAFFAETNGVTDTGGAADLTVGFHQRGIAFSSLFGTLAVNYPAGEEVPFNRIELEPWWGAWKPMLLALIVTATLVWLFFTWLALATFYSPIAWMLAYLKDRQLTLSGGWKLSAAALLPGALLVALGILLYGLGVIDLLGFLVIWVMHFLAGWVMTVLGVLALPKVVTAEPVLPNPFQGLEAGAESRPQNPFAAPVANRAPEESK